MVLSLEISPVKLLLVPRLLIAYSLSVLQLMFVNELSVLKTFSLFIRFMLVLNKISRLF